MRYLEQVTYDKKLKISKNSIHNATKKYESDPFKAVSNL